MSTIATYTKEAIEAGQYPDLPKAFKERVGKLGEAVLAGQKAQIDAALDSLVELFKPLGRLKGTLANHEVQGRFFIEQYFTDNSDALRAVDFENIEETHDNGRTVYSGTWRFKNKDGGSLAAKFEFMVDPNVTGVKHSIERLESNRLDVAAGSGQPATVSL